MVTQPVLPEQNVPHGCFFLMKGFGRAVLCKPVYRSKWHNAIYYYYDPDSSSSSYY